MKKKWRDITGETFGRLFVLGYSRDDGWRELWWCVCECTPYMPIERRRDQIIRNKYPSCGCWHQEINVDRQVGKRQKENKIELLEDYGVCYIDKGMKFYFDLDDYDIIKAHFWSDDGRGYVRTRTGGKGMLHRILLNAPEDMYVDHIDRDPLNNRRCNLRLATPKQNNQNRRKPRGKSSKYIGVSFNKRSRLWKAGIEHIFLGYFHEEKDAAIAYNAKAEELGYLTRNIIEE